MEVIHEMNNSSNLGDCKMAKATIICSFDHVAQPLIMKSRASLNR